ncbi:Uu.00g132880.m01.CDS01 [Anthostomella pinea]|uniref:Uu.00g132880.m01.CDS01 n=1 Tax=Anthostomella pinea TaxID=933095 RepID=A0AAI8VSY9_9PEZI|nr:Uu.00g132880.m01.CDS01 [Anthostomella pinea]
MARRPIKQPHRHPPHRSHTLINSKTLPQIVLSVLALAAALVLALPGTAVLSAEAAQATIIGTCSSDGQGCQLGNGLVYSCYYGGCGGDCKGVGPCDFETVGMKTHCVYGC